MTKLSKDERFQKLLEEYAVAVHVTDQLMDSGLIEKKIKIKDYELFNDDLTSRIAYEIRIAKNRVNAIINEPSDALVIVDAYLMELKARGSEWQFSDLEEKFEELRSVSKEIAEFRAENGIH